MPIWIEVVAFQVVWLACVLSAARANSWLGCACAVVFTLATCAGRRAPRRWFFAACGAGALGSSADALIRAQGWIAYAGAPLAGVWAPAWIVALWIAFAATLASSLRWLRARWWLSVPFAALGAPLSYGGAARLGAVEFGTPRWSALIGVGLSWVAALHLAQWTQARFSGGGGEVTA